MSKIKQVGPGHWVGPEDEGYQPHFYTTENAVRNYPFGSLIQEEPLQPGNKKIKFTYYNEEIDKLGEFFELFSAGGHQHYLDMRLHSVTARGRGLYLSIFLGIIYLFIYLLVGYYETDWFDWAVLGTLLLITFGELFRPIATPVRFHKTNQEVYVWHKKVLYKIPWQECEISVTVAKSHMGYGHLSDGYELVVWLNPNHAVNRNLSGAKHTRLVLLNTMSEHHAPAYGYWEYIRRYMTGEEPLWYEINESPRTPGFDHQLIHEDGILSALFTYIFGIPIMFFFRPHGFALWFCPFRRKWPEQVHQWTGERCNWH